MKNTTMSKTEREAEARAEMEAIKARVAEQSREARERRKAEETKGRGFFVAVANRSLALAELGRCGLREASESVRARQRLVRYHGIGADGDLPGLTKAEALEIVAKERRGRRRRRGR